MRHMLLDEVTFMEISLQIGHHRWENAGKRVNHRDLSECVRLVTANANSSQRTLNTLNAFSYNEHETSVTKGFEPYVLKRSAHNALPSKRLKSRGRQSGIPTSQII